MAKPRNQQTEALIKKCAFRSFLEIGYDKTSYTKIAADSGLSKTLVQYYYPKKSELAIIAFREILDKIADVCRAEAVPAQNAYDELLNIGSIYFEMLVRYARQFTIDIISSRTLSGEILAFDIDWGLRYLNKTAAFDEALEYDLISSMGGFYELLYYCLLNNKDLPIFNYLRQVVVALSQALEKSPVSEIFPIDEKKLQDIMAQVMEGYELV